MKTLINEEQLREGIAGLPRKFVPITMAGR